MTASPYAASASAAATAGVWPPAPRTAVAAAPAALLQLQRDLQRLLAPLERALTEEWPTHFDALDRIVASIETSVPKWCTLLAADAACARADEEAAQAAQLVEPARAAAAPAAASNTNHSADDASSFFTAPLPLSSPSASGSASSGAASERVWGAVGVLAALPGHLAKLAALQQRHEITSSFNQIIGMFDAIHELYSLQKKQFTPSQLAQWCSAASGGTAAAAASGSAHKKKSGGSASKGKGSASAVAEPTQPPANSVLNIMRRVELLERMLSAEYDAHQHAWGQLQKALATAAAPTDAAAAFELKRGSTAQSEPDTATGASAAVSTFAGWLHVDLDEALSPWRAAHDVAASHAHMREELRLVTGKAPRELTAAKLWVAEEATEETEGGEEAKTE